MTLLIQKLTGALTSLLAVKGHNLSISGRWAVLAMKPPCWTVPTQQKRNGPPITATPGSTADPTLTVRILITPTREQMCFFTADSLSIICMIPRVVVFKSKEDARKPLYSKCSAVSEEHGILC